MIITTCGESARQTPSRSKVLMGAQHLQLAQDSAAGVGSASACAATAFSTAGT
jgi:hypothetical protein